MQQAMYKKVGGLPLTRFIFNMRNIPGQLKAFNMPDSDHMVIANADPINYFVVILKNYNLYKQKFDSTTFEFFHRSNAAANIVNLIDIVREPDHIAAMYELFDESFEMTNHETTLKPYF
uniref:Uncharacterized protein n=1 Tax=Romanomermis culicivorax TaxID=13658 RepID=A0A915JJV0_ROMCU